MTSQSQGRLKVVSSSKSCLNWIFTWPVTDLIEVDDSNLIIDWAIIWYIVNLNDLEPDQWTSEVATEVSNEWMKIPTNSFVDATVKSYTLKFLANLLNLFWMNNLNIHIIRQFKLVLRKAAADFEATTVAGFLKLAVIKNTTRPETLIFNGTSRKTPTNHFACSVQLVYRSKASSLDIENYYAALNDNGGVEIKVFIFELIFELLEYRKAHFSQTSTVCELDIERIKSLFIIVWIIVCIHISVCELSRILLSSIASILSLSPKRATS